MSNRFSVLSPVESGQDIRSVASADRINAIQDLLLSLWQGDNIKVGRGGLVSRGGDGGINLSFKGGRGRSSSQKCVPWSPTVKDESTGGNPQYKLYLNPGTVNGMLSSAWDVGADLPADGSQRYIVLEVLLTAGKVSTINYLLESIIPGANATNPQSENVLPTTLKIIMGTVKDNKVCMLYDRNLYLETVRSYLELLTTPTYGVPPYIVHWGFKVTVID